MTDDLGSMHPLVEARDGEASLGSDSSYAPFMLSDEESVEVCSSGLPHEDIVITALRVDLAVTAALAELMLPPHLVTCVTGMYLNLCFVHTLLFSALILTSISFML